jgi:DNA primase
VLLVEGEKVAEAIETLEIAATTAAMGAGTWFDDYAPPLVGAHVVLCPDSDFEGRRHMVQAGRSLLDAGVAVFGPLELCVDDQTGTDLYDLLAEYAATLRAVDPSLDRQAVRDRLRQLVLAMVRQCPRATLESLAAYFERAEWRVDPRGRELRQCDRCGRERPHAIRAGVAFCPCGGLQT